MSENSDIIEHYRGVPIRKYNRVYIRVTAFEMKKFIDAKIDKEMSARKAIEQTNILCPCSSPLEIVKSTYGKGNGTDSKNY